MALIIVSTCKAVDSVFEHRQIVSGVIAPLFGAFRTSFVPLDFTQSLASPQT